MNRKELNKYITDNYFPDCSTCGKQYDCGEDLEPCDKFEISDRTWNEYSKPDTTEKALELASLRVSGMFLEGEALNAERWKQRFIEAAKEQK